MLSRMNIFRQSSRYMNNIVGNLGKMGHLILKLNQTKQFITYRVKNDSKSLQILWHT